MVTVPIFVKPCLLDNFFNSVYSKYNENLTCVLATDTITATQRWSPHKAFPFLLFCNEHITICQVGYNFFSVQWLRLDSSIRPSWVGTFILDDTNNPASKTLCLIKPKIMDIVWSKACFLEVRMKSYWTTVNICKHYESLNMYLLIQHRHSLMLMLFTA